MFCAVQTAQAAAKVEISSAFGLLSQMRHISKQVGNPIETLLSSQFGLNMAFPFKCFPFCCGRHIQIKNSHNDIDEKRIHINRLENKIKNECIRRKANDDVHPFHAAVVLESRSPFHYLIPRFQQQQLDKDRGIRYERSPGVTAK